MRYNSECVSTISDDNNESDNNEKNVVSNSGTAGTRTTKSSFFTLEPVVRPLHLTFEDAGVFGAIRRLFTQLQTEFACSCPTVPSWVYCNDFAYATTQCSSAIHSAATYVAMDLVRSQRRMREVIAAAQRDEFEDIQEVPQLVHIPEMHPQNVAATVRLCFGETLEAFAEYKAMQICGVYEAPLRLSHIHILCHAFTPSLHSLLMSRFLAAQRSKKTLPGFATTVTWLLCGPLHMRSTSQRYRICLRWIPMSPRRKATHWSTRTTSQSTI